MVKFLWPFLRLFSSPLYKAQWRSPVGSKLGQVPRPIYLQDHTAKSTWPALCKSTWPSCKSTWTLFKSMKTITYWIVCQLLSIVSIEKFGSPLGEGRGGSPKFFTSTGDLARWPIKNTFSLYPTLITVSVCLKKGLWRLIRYCQFFLCRRFCQALKERRWKSTCLTTQTKRGNMWYGQCYVKIFKLIKCTGIGTTLLWPIKVAVINILLWN